MLRAGAAATPPAHQRERESTPKSSQIAKTKPVEQVVVRLSIEDATITAGWAVIETASD
jgi:hypothetical protein